MPLLDRSRMPPGGFPYREPSIAWHTPSPYLPFSMIATQIQQARINNPTAALDPSREACEDALDLYTCTRLNNDPAWCAVEGSIAAAIAAEPRKKAAAGCGSCGSRRSKSA